MAQAVTGHGLLPKAISVHAKRSSYYRPGPQRANPASQSRFVLCSSTQNKSTEVSDHGEEPVRPQHEERFVSVSDLLAEVKDLGDDFVFEDKDESADVWGHEQRLRAQTPSDEATTSSEVKNAMDTTQADILSAYSADQGFQETTVDNVHEALQQSLTAEPLLLDVRTPQEYRSGHAVKAVNIELDALSEAVRAGTLDDWKEEGPILVICQSGKRSAQATVRLSKVFDFQQVINVKGGTSAWIAAGYPTEQGDGMTMDAPPHLL